MNILNDTFAIATTYTDFLTLYNQEGRLKRL